MKAISLKCPDCGGTMQDGFLLEDTYGAHQAVRWVKGTPVKSFWTGLKLKGREKWQIVTYRCADCGLLKSYAREETK